MRVEEGERERDSRLLNMSEAATLQLEANQLGAPPLACIALLHSATLNTPVGDPLLSG